jgi:hypothetical protein
MKANNFWSLRRKDMKEFRMRAFFGIIGLAGAGFLLSGVTSTVGCSSSSGGSGGTTGSAGSGAKGGSTGTAGTTGSGGSGGSGGSSGGSGGGGGSSSALGCQVSDLPAGDPNPLIADFEATDGGSPVIPIGGTFTYASPTGATAPTATVTAGKWHITLDATGMASAISYVGVGIYFNGNATGTECVDATKYTGIKFDLTGTIGGTGCTAQYSTNDSAHANNGTDPKGAGDANSYAPQTPLTVPTGSATVMVPFTGPSPSSGNPMIAIDKTKLTGVQWQFAVPAGATMGCTVAIDIDNVSFY